LILRLPIYQSHLPAFKWLSRCWDAIEKLLIYLLSTWKTSPGAFLSTDFGRHIFSYSCFATWNL